MRTFKICIILLWSCCSCLDDLEDHISSFERVYGSNLESQAFGMISIESNGFLIFGSQVTAIETTTTQTEKHQPLIIRTDDFGNELWSRSYPIEKLQLTRSDLFGEHHVGENGVSITDLVQLKNGHYFALIKVDLRGLLEQDWPAQGWPGFMIFNEDFEVDALGLFNQTPLEVGADLSRYRRDFSIHKHPDTDELILLAKSAYDFSKVPVFNYYYSIYILGMDGEIKSILNIESDIMTYRPADLALDRKGNAVVAGKRQPYTTNFSFACGDLFVHKIDIHTGEIMNETVLRDQDSEIRTPNSIVTMDPTGFVIQINQDRSCFPSHLNRSTGLEFVDNDLSSSQYVKVLPTDLLCRSDHLIQTNDGGLAGVVYYCEDYDQKFFLLKTDNTGKEVWRSEDFSSTDVTDLQEVANGGYVILNNKEFNLSGNRITLLKLDANGNLK